MELPLQITVRGFPHSRRLDAAIRRKAAKLERLQPRLTSCRVVIDLPSRHKHQGREFVVRLDLRMPGTELAINRDHHEDPYVAMRDAFDAAMRKLGDRRRRRAP